MKDEQGGRLCSFIFHRNGNQIKEFRKSWRTTVKAAGCANRIFTTFEGTPFAISFGMELHKKCVWILVAIEQSACLIATRLPTAKTSARPLGKLKGTESLNVLWPSPRNTVQHYKLAGKNDRNRDTFDLAIKKAPDGVSEAFYSKRLEWLRGADLN